MNRSNPTDLAYWFATGIDAVGRGDYDEAIELWSVCLADDYSGRFTFMPGGPSMEFPTPDTDEGGSEARAHIRAGIAKTDFEQHGYYATHHHLLNVHERERHASRAEVSAYIQANHFLPNNTVNVFWGTWSATCVEESGLWRLQREEIVGTSFIKLNGGAIN